MATRNAAERVESAEAKPHGKMMAFPAASYNRRGSRDEMRAQFERLLIFVLCALWGLGMTLWALTAVANWSWSHGAVSHVAASTNAAMSALANSPFSVGTQFPITLVRYVIGW
ncbi:MAG: hypothetical protein JWO20_2722 [Candidatus Angelobacter sp.]|jgi:hypothetical protein|nr:hypothetical protein [Candidatus Angelobacter sp.]